MTEGPRLSLKAIAEQAVRTKNEAQNEATSQPTIATALSPEPIAVDPEPQRLPAPPPMPRAVAKPAQRSAPSANLLLPATLIAIVSAALAGGVVWWFVQTAPPTTSALEAAVAAATPAVAATAAPTAVGATTALSGATPTADPSTVASTPAVTPLADLPKAGSAANARGTAKPQTTTSPPASTAELDRAIANVDPKAGPVLTGSDPPIAPAGGVQVAPSDLTPSSGAVQAAIGSVLGNARSCVAGDREASRARVVFDSTGAVSGVTVTGPAAGTPAETCIRTALSKARVAPFQKPNYSVDTTIRP
jgi:hypothetical protein